MRISDWSSDVCSSDLPAPDRRLRPGGFRRQAHEDRLDVAAGLQAEPGAAVVEQVELGVAAAAEELVAALLLGPGLRHVAAHQGGIDLQEGAADVLSEGEVALTVAAVEVVVENAADAACLAAVGTEGVLVAPLLEGRAHV